MTSTTKILITSVISIIVGIIFLPLLILTVLNLGLNGLDTFLQFSKLTITNDLEQDLSVHYLLRNHDNNQLYVSRKNSLSVNESDSNTFGFEFVECIYIETNKDFYRVALGTRLDEDESYTVTELLNQPSCQPRQVDSISTLIDGTWKPNNETSPISSITFDGKTSTTDVLVDLACNTASGDMYITKNPKENTGWIHITDIGSSEVGCDQNEAEKQTIKELQNINRYELSEDQLILHGNGFTIELSKNRP